MMKPGNVIRTYVILTVLMFLLVAILPPNQVTLEQYNLSHSQYRILLVLVYLPLAGIWYAAFYGYQKLRQYADAIKGSPEGSGFDLLARGTKWLVLGLPIPVLLSLVINAIANSYENFRPTAVILNNYISLIFVLFAFTIMSNGARNLVSKAKLRISSTATRNIQMIFVLIGVVFCYLTFRNLDLHSLTASDNSYFLPVWILVLTVIIPYLYAWFMGLLSAFDILQLAKTAKGTFYRQALQIFATGLSIVIAALIASQYIRSAIPRTGRVSLGAVLLLVYILLIVMAAGYILLATGANKLKKIEEA